MTDKPKRRIRVRRKRRSDGADDAADLADDALDGVDVDGVDTVGCCLFELVIATSALAALLAVPVGLLIS